LRFDGQISVFDPRHANSPCYACIFPPNEPFTEVSCASMGIFSPLVGMIGSLQAAQALQILLGFGEPLVGRMLLCDALNTQMTGIQIQRDPQCSVCGKATS
jgi:molybdopterin/thiamine biosynthesis adenylyltransferase